MKQKCGFIKRVDEGRITAMNIWKSDVLSISPSIEQMTKGSCSKHPLSKSFMVVIQPLSTTFLSLVGGTEQGMHSYNPHVGFESLSIVNVYHKHTV